MDNRIPKTPQNSGKAESIIKIGKKMMALPAIRVFHGDLNTFYSLCLFLNHPTVITILKTVQI